MIGGYGSTNPTLLSDQNSSAHPIWLCPCHIGVKSCIWHFKLEWNIEVLQTGQPMAPSHPLTQILGWIQMGQGGPKVALMRYKVHNSWTSMAGY